jgi:hypothetical protein
MQQSASLREEAEEETKGQTKRKSVVIKSKAQAKRSHTHGREERGKNTPMHHQPVPQGNQR